MSWSINRVQDAWQFFEAERVAKMGPSALSEDANAAARADESYRRRRWIKDMFNDFLIVVDDYDSSAMYRVDFEVTDSAVNFSEPVPVRVSYEPARAASGLTKVLLSRDDSLLSTDTGDVRKSLFSERTAYVDMVELSKKPFPGAAAPFKAKKDDSEDESAEKEKPTLAEAVDDLLDGGHEATADEIAALAKKFSVSEADVKAAIRSADGKIAMSALDWGSVDDEILRLTSL